MPAILSILRQGFGLSKQLPKSHIKICQRGMGDGPRTMHITPSRWPWHKFKDMLHFYVMLGAIPLGILVVGVNVFIGPAKLAKTPEGYRPLPHEHYSHPITRWISRNFTHTYQEDYEKRLAVMYIEDEKAQMRMIEHKIIDTIKRREDVRGYTFQPILTKYHKNVREDYHSHPHTWGDNK